MKSGDGIIAKRIPVRTGRVLSLLGITKIRRTLTFRFCMFSWMEMADKLGILPQNFGELNDQAFMENALWAAEYASRGATADPDKYDMKDVRQWMAAMTSGEILEISSTMLNSRIGGLKIIEINDRIKDQAEKTGTPVEGGSEKK